MEGGMTFWEAKRLCRRERKKAQPFDFLLIIEYSIVNNKNLCFFCVRCSDFCCAKAQDLLYKNRAQSLPQRSGGRLRRVCYMLQKIWETIESEGLIGAGELVVAGISGGADSICLLSVLLELKERLGIQVAAVHIHHGIRGEEADRDEAFVRAFCESRRVPVLVYHRNVPELARENGLSLEEAGRKTRYQCFGEALKELSGRRLAVAHNRDDNAETVLFHLFRGSGLRGLSGMDYLAPLPLEWPAPSDIWQGTVLIRPLLDISRKEIETYLRERGISWCRDSTNSSGEYSRNRIRLNILPEAGKINEAASANIVRAAGMLKEAGRWMERQAEAWLDGQAVFEPGRHGSRTVPEADVLSVRLPGKELASLEPVMSGLIIRKAFARLTGSLKDFSKQHTDSVLKLAEKGTGRQMSLPGGVTARNEYGALILSAGQEKPKADGKTPEQILVPSERRQEAELFGCRFRYRLLRRESGEKFPENRYTKWFAYDKIKGNLSLRGRRPGDWFQAFADGGRQTVKAYMINEKLPPHVRGQIPLLAEGSHVLWIVGGRISEAYKVTEECRQVLEITVFGAEM